MTVLITLTVAGADSGPFDLYSDLDGYVSAFETGVSKASLLAGYSSSAVPNGTTTIRIKSTGACNNYIDISVVTTTTTTSTTTTAFVYEDNYNVSTTEPEVCTGPVGLILFSSAPFAPGVVLYTDNLLTTPLVGYNYITLGTGGAIYNISSTTGVVGAATGNTC